MESRRRTLTRMLMLPFTAAVAVLGARTAAMAAAPGTPGDPAPAATPGSHDRLRFAADRAELEDLHARYLFALDWQDADAYAATFTEDGVLDWASGVVTGREAIRALVHDMKAAVDQQAATDAPLRPARRRHFVTNTVLSVHGDHARSVAYWFEYYNANPDRHAESPNYGHYEDELRRVNGRWLFTRRKIYNEVMASRAAPAENPVRSL